jgi:YfiH family protein
MSVEWVEPDWPAPPGIRAISTGRGGGVSCAQYASLNLGTHVGDAPDSVAENRARLRAAVRLPSEPKWLGQVHGITAVDLDAEVTGAADAGYTRRAGVVCAILTADCLPVVFASESGDTLGAAHAGWRGLSSGILEATVRAMCVPPSRLLAWLGPSIGPDHFEVGGEVREAFIAKDRGAEVAFVANARARFMADLPELARRRLRTLGIDRIYGGNECTYANATRYFSHRRDGNTGRQATLIWREAG